MHLTDEDLIIARARRMRAFLASTDVQEAFADIEREFFDEFTGLHPNQAESLKHAWDGYRRIRNKLQSWADDLTILESSG